MADRKITRRGRTQSGTVSGVSGKTSGRGNKQSGTVNGESGRTGSRGLTSSSRGSKRSPIVRSR